MALTILRTQLESFVTRSGISSVKGIRKVSSSLSTQKNQSGLQKVLGFVLKPVGWLAYKAVELLIKGLGFSVTAIVGAVISTTQFLWNFNWNISDTDIERMQKQLWAQSGVFLGNTVGTTMGWTVCGFGTVAGIATFNEPLALYLLKEVGEEAIDEILGSAAQLIRHSSVSLLKSGILESYKNVRKWLKNPKHPFYKRLKKIFGKRLDDWGKEGAEAFTFAKATEEAIESLPDGFIENFVQEAYESFTESCTEALYVVAAGTDSYLAMQKMAHQHNVLGPYRTVEITFDRSLSQKSSTP